MHRPVNRALRQIGKRSIGLNGKAIAVAKQIKRSETKAASWVAKDALRELYRQEVQLRLYRKAKR